MTASCSPSSSAVTIPIPGKSILKQPPPAPQSLFSRFTKFLPSTVPASSQSPADDSKTLKRAHFILPHIATVYPISSVNPPSTPTLKDEKKAIEEKEAERRRRIVRGSSSSSGTEETDWWGLDKVDAFYRECCEGCEETPDPAVIVAFKNAANTDPRSLDISGVQITTAMAGILSDVFTIEWGLRKLTLRECDLDEHTLKPILHALLIPGTLSFFSVASNRRLKTGAFRLLGAYTSKAKSLEFLDLSQNQLDKKAVDYVAASLTTAPNPGLVSLRLDDCSLRPAALEALSRVVRTSSLRNISLRHNKINAAGAVALAIMIRDYPDVVPVTPASSFIPGSPASSNLSLSPPSTPTTPTFGLPSTLSPAPPFSNLAPRHAQTHPIPPRHPSTGPQTTYTPYVPRRARRPTPAPLLLSPSGLPVPLITSSSQGGVTTRHPVVTPLSTPGSLTPDTAASRHSVGPSAALLDKVRALDALPRLGALRTLDLKGNDLRAGITYVAQVLKRNRTLKVLNLSENKLDIQCLVAMAEALKYNLSLETLNLSKNPCCGPGLEGIQSLRTAFTLNTALKRLFLSSTSLGSAGAIALAEFLPESMSLLHLDLTLNELGLAGVMALSSGLKANHVMRCLDLNIPPGDEEFARISRDILNSCVRNTEEAESQSIGANSESGRGHGKGVWGMIEESSLAKSIREDEEKMINSDIIVQARSCIRALKNLTTSNNLPGLDVRSIADRAKALLLELASSIEATTDANRLEELLTVNDELTSLLARIPTPDRPRLKLQGLGLQWEKDAIDTDIKKGNSILENGQAQHDSPKELVPDEGTLSPKVDKGKAKAEPEPEIQERILSPNFLITESEDEDEGPRSPDLEDDSDALPPADRARILIEEEGEVFRKGTHLLTPEHLEGDYAGEELRKELLEAMVERPPPRPLLDEFGMEIDPPQDPGSPIASPDEPKKPPPRAYVSRRSSNSSLISPATPTGI